MAYKKQTWENYPLETTPISAERLNHIEQGIYDNSTSKQENLVASDDATIENNKIIVNANNVASNIVIGNVGKSELYYANTYEMSYDTIYANLDVGGRTIQQTSPPKLFRYASFTIDNPTNVSIKDYDDLVLHDSDPSDTSKGGIWKANDNVEILWQKYAQINENTFLVVCMFTYYQTTKYVYFHILEYSNDECISRVYDYTQMTYPPLKLSNLQEIRLFDVVKCNKTDDGIYTLKATVKNGQTTYDWVAES